MQNENSDQSSLPERFATWLRGTLAADDQPNATLHWQNRRQ